MSDTTTRRISAMREEIDWLVSVMERRAPLDAADLLVEHPDERIVEVLKRLEPDFALKVLERLPEERRDAILPSLPENKAAQWETNLYYPDDTVGRIMTPPIGVLPVDMTVADACVALRKLAQTVLFTYAYCVDEEDCLVGVVVMRDLLFATPQQLLHEIMVPDPFAFHPETGVSDATHEVLERHYPVYPVVDDHNELIGLVHGYELFEEHAEALSATPGKMVGVQDEEYVSTGWRRSFRSRHPWLQLNLMTAFLAAIVVTFFEDTIARIVLLAAFLPVLAGQSGNTGCQAMAVTLRGLALNELEPGTEKLSVVKEAWLGLLNGLFVGVTAAIAMYLFAQSMGEPHALILSFIVLLAMTGSCVISGITGVLVPLSLNKMGADPATASSIFLTTATDVVSMGLLLGLATLMIS